MDKLKMQSMDRVQANIEKIRELFPNAVTEVKRDGKVELAVDFDVLKQELADSIIDERELRYQFTWPDKQKAVLLANTPISATLRPRKEESVDFDNTQNLYIEGDNLDVLKLLQETYLGKIKMIYIDPPYNTGKDFVYNDEFAQDSDEYSKNSGQYDDQGNRLVQNTESNGRFHTDWLNMIYPRLRLAKDLITEDGVIFISIDDSEQSNLKKLCDEIFGESNFVAKFTRKGSGGRQDSKHFAIVHEYVYCYSKNISQFCSGKIVKSDESYPYYDESKKLYYKTQLLRKWGENSKRSDRPNLFYPIVDPDGNDFYPMLSATEEGCWRWGKDTMNENIKKGLVEFKQKDGQWVAYEKVFEPTDGEIRTKLYSTIIDDISNSSGATLIKELFVEKIFDYPKPVELVKRIISLGGVGVNDTVIDFFSGSATTAHAVMQLNAEDGGKRKFIMVQLPEPCDEKSEAYKAGYKNICEIGKERIRRAGRKILADNKVQDLIDSIDIVDNTHFSMNRKFEEIMTDNSLAKRLDVGFRVLKLDSSNMKDVYYKPEDYSQTLLGGMEDNIKSDRTPLDLLFQVMLDLGKPLSAKIEEKKIAGKKVFIVDGNDLIACFDTDITDEAVKTIAQLKPLYAVFRDSSLADDSTAANFEQIFATYSPNTVRRVL